MSQVSLLFKDRILSIHQLNRHKDLIIGNAPDCNIQIDSLAVSPRHAKIGFADRQYIIEELDNETNILVNNIKVDNYTELSDGDKITVGKHTLVFTFDERNEDHPIKEPAPAPEINQGVGWIQYLNGNKMGTTMQIKQSMANITDAKEENIALISSRSDGFYISYLKGKHPPLVNDSSIGEKSMRLKNNSRITIGSQELLFYIENRAT